MCFLCIFSTMGADRKKTGKKHESARYDLTHVLFNFNKQYACSHSHHAFSLQSRIYMILITLDRLMAFDNKFAIVLII